MKLFLRTCVITVVLGGIFNPVHRLKYHITNFTKYFNMFKVVLAITLRLVIMWRC